MKPTGAFVRRLMQSKMLVSKIECGTRAHDFALIVLSNGMPAEDPNFLPVLSADLKENEIRFTYLDGRIEVLNFETGAVVSLVPERIKLT